MDISSIPLIVQSPSAAAIVLVLVEGESQPRAIGLRNVEAGKHSCFYGDFATQKPYIFRSDECGLYWIAIQSMILKVSLARS